MSTATVLKPDTQVQFEIMRRMLQIRRFEERVQALCAGGELQGSVHLYIGEEAVAAGVCAALQDDDYITSTHRGHGHVIAKGGDIARSMAELFGRATGYCGGKGGSMHIADMALGIIGANGIVGAGLPIATGAGLSARLRGTQQVSVCFFGDGASNQGAFHESLNLAGVWSLPVIFVCENNGYGELTPMEQVTSRPEIAPRGDAYGIPSALVDGNDAYAVYAATNEAVARARAGEGPTLIEARTYRMRQHSEGLDVIFGQTRPQDEIDEWTARDPLVRHRAVLLAAGVDASEVDELDRAVQADVEAAVEFARSSPLPSPDAAFTDMWLSEPETSGAQA